MRCLPHWQDGHWPIHASVTQVECCLWLSRGQVLWLLDHTSACELNSTDHSPLYILTRMHGLLLGISLAFP